MVYHTGWMVYQTAQDFLKSSCSLTENFQITA